jgi:tRNA threonylcarbamoyladenosine biosynthesis protein TsaB
MTRSLLIIDTATRTPIVALADSDGRVLAEERWQSQHRHGEELLARIDQLLGSRGTSRGDLAGVIVGTGPGSFTGLRIGLATAKTIAYALGIPIIGVPTTVALASAYDTQDPNGESDVMVTLPAGAVDRYVHRVGAEGSDPEIVADAEIAADAIAIDIEQAPEQAKLRGQAALDGLAASLAALGANKLGSSATDDIETLVPTYVALPRGIARAAAEMEWSPDLR